MLPFLVIVVLLLKSWMGYPVVSSRDNEEAKRNDLSPTSIGRDGNFSSTTLEYRFVVPCNRWQLEGFHPGGPFVSILYDVARRN